jgi:hypothetical protein
MRFGLFLQYYFYLDGTKFGTWGVSHIEGVGVTKLGLKKNLVNLVVCAD